MAHDVFISYSSHDKSVADAVCAAVEQAGIRCWIAPRDIEPGLDWGSALIQGIHGSRVMVLVFSHAANTSPQILREVERAIHLGIVLVPLRIEDVLPEGALEFHLGTVHWLDAMSPPMEAHLHRLTDTLLAILKRERSQPAEATAPSPAISSESGPPPTPRHLPSPRAGSKQIFTRARILILALLLLIIGGIATWFVTAKNKPEKIFTKNGYADDVHCVAFSPDGHFLAAGGWYEQNLGSSYGAIEIWEVATGKPSRGFSEIRDFIKSVAYSPDAHYLAAGGENSGNIVIWDLTTNRKLRTIAGLKPDTQVSVSFSSDGRYLAAGASDIRLWDVATGNLLNEFSGNHGYVFSLAFSPGGSYLAAGTSGQTVELWDLETGKQLQAQTGLGGYVSAVAFSPNGRYLAAGGGDLSKSVLQVWDMESRTQSRTLAGHEGAVNSVAFSPDGNDLASAGIDGTTRLWSVETGKEVRVFMRRTAVKGAVTSVAFSPDGHYLAVGDGDFVSLWAPYRK